MFQHVEFYPGDPILGLVETYLQDPRDFKVNLGIGIYFDEAGQLPVLNCVRQDKHFFLNALCFYLSLSMYFILRSKFSRQNYFSRYLR